MSNYRLAVLEGRWFDKKNTSVKAMFDLLLDLHTGNPNDYLYQMFNTRESFS